MKKTLPISLLLGALWFCVQIRAQQTEWMQGAFSTNSPCGAVDVTNLVGWWPFDAGSPTPDASGNGNSGALDGATAPRYVTGEITNALSFDGSTSYVQVNAAPVNSFPMTQMAWFKLTNGSYTTAATVMGEIQLSSLDAVYIRIFNQFDFGNSMQVVSQDPTAANAYELYTALAPDSAWHHVACVCTNSTGFTIYIDGVAQAGTVDATGTAPTHTAMDHTFIGNIEYNGGSFFGPFPGNIDDPRIYSRALTASEISTIYQHGTNGCP